MTQSEPQYAYKYLDTDGTASNGGSGKWYLPHGTRPGKWMPIIKDIVPCERGYHLCRIQDLLKWSGTTLWKVEYRGVFLVHDDSKIVAQQARLISEVATWNDRTQRLFACDCAEHVAPLHMAELGKWQPMDAISVARRYANGQATDEELDAAWAAARAARDTCDAARAAARAARDTWDAARDAARAAAWAARDARDAETKWQLERLMDYIEGRIA